MNAKMNISQILAALDNNEVVTCDLINPHDTQDTRKVGFSRSDFGLQGKLNIHEFRTGIKLFDLDLNQATRPLEFTYIANSGNYDHYARYAR